MVVRPEGASCACRGTKAVPALPRSRGARPPCALQDIIRSLWDPDPASVFHLTQIPRFLHKALNAFVLLLSARVLTVQLVMDRSPWRRPIFYPCVPTNRPQVPVHLSWAVVQQTPTSGAWGALCALRHWLSPRVFQRTQCPGKRRGNVGLVIKWTKLEKIE